MGDDKYGDPNRSILTRSILMAEVEASLDALKVNDVDMYMYHRDDPRIPVGQFVAWANEIIDEGKTTAWGVSNWSFERFQEAHDFACANGFQPPKANSPQLSLAAPACEVWPTTYSVACEEHEDQILWYHQNGVELVCWEVLAKGFMAVPDLWCEKTVDPSFFHKEVELGSEEWRLQRIQKAYCNDENYRRRRNALRVAEEYGMSLAQIAALYAMSVSPSVSVIMGFLEPSQIDDVKDLHHYFLDKHCLIGDDEAIEKSIKLVDMRTLQTTDSAMNLPNVLLDSPDPAPKAIQAAR
jgi:aryl-alcohol dehydrogenase-like predicted oxidoreductase